MFEIQNVVEISQADLLPRVCIMMSGGWRLVQICCSVVDGKLQLDYSFDKDGKFEGLRVFLEMNEPQMTSVTGVYFCAFAYENEIHDLFGVKFHGLAVDYEGSFYRTKGKSPFANAALELTRKSPAAKEG